MRHVKNIFLVLAFALSAAAFSTSAMAASDSKPHRTGARYVVVSILNITSGWHILLTPA
ncbi:TPA: PagK family vesicle-borne virulence factor [Salmonella enterica subsp. houtenae serovar O:57:z4,z32:-]|nr:hypothetical protein [Salmonella enterica subsp. houtenae]